MSLSLSLPFLRPAASLGADLPDTSQDHTTLYLHAGCPAKGRLATLHALDLASLTWSALASAPEPGRGGTNLSPLPGTTTLARFGGFAGYELGGFDTYDLVKDAWESHEVAVEGGGEGPDKRSVALLQKVEGGVEWAGKKVVALLAHGEREGAPAELGHDGAGFVSPRRSPSRVNLD